MNAGAGAIAPGARHTALDEGTELSLARTRLAGERTLMSWIRTSFSMISFGFTIGKFLEYLNSQPGSEARIGEGRTLPTLLILLGLISLVVGCWEHRHLVVQLNARTGERLRPSAVGVIAVLVALIGLLAFAGMFVRIDWF
jgi:putative membrane protein